MRKFWMLVGVPAIALATAGCVSKMYDKSKEGSTVMDNTVCKNGVCTQKPKPISMGDEAPVPTTLPPLLQTTEKALRAQ